MQQVAYPVSFSVAYPERPLDRLTTAFRWIIAIPIMVVLASVSGGSFRFGEAAQIVIAAGGAVFLGPMLMILFRAYAFLLVTGHYPPFRLAA